jgi:hypothetical protein
MTNFLISLLLVGCLISLNKSQETNVSEAVNQTTGPYGGSKGDPFNLLDGVMLQYDEVCDFSYMILEINHESDRINSIAAIFRRYSYQQGGPFLIGTHITGPYGKDPETVESIDLIQADDKIVGVSVCSGKINGTKVITGLRFVFSDGTSHIMGAYRKNDAKCVNATPKGSGYRLLYISGLYGDLINQLSFHWGTKCKRESETPNTFKPQTEITGPFEGNVFNFLPGIWQQSGKDDNFPNIIFDTLRISHEPDRINSIEATYQLWNYSTPIYGKQHETITKVDLIQSYENIVGASVCIGDVSGTTVITGLQFVFKDGTSHSMGDYGKSRLNCEDFTPKISGYILHNFSGRSSNLINELDFHWISDFAEEKACFEDDHCRQDFYFCDWDCCYDRIVHAEGERETGYWCMFS